MHHLPRAQATCLRREEAGERCSEGEHPLYFWLSRPPFRSRLPFTPLPLRFSRQVLLLCVSQRSRQLGVSAVIGQQEDYW